MLWCIRAKCVSSNLPCPMKWSDNQHWNTFNMKQMLTCTNLKQKKQDTRHVRTFTFQHVGVSRPVNVHTCQWYMPAYVTVLKTTDQMWAEIMQVGLRPRGWWEMYSSRTAAASRCEENHVLRQRRKNSRRCLASLQPMGLLGKSATCWPIGGITRRGSRVYLTLTRSSGRVWIGRTITNMLDIHQSVVATFKT